jgi:pimeloyl-ACP methyl ester carboxylesterase
MKVWKQLRLLSAILMCLPAFAALTVLHAQSLNATGPVRCQVELAPELSLQPVAGRLLLFMTRGNEPKEILEPSFFDLDKIWIAAKEVTNLGPGQKIDVDTNATFFPAEFSTAAPGNYQIMALLDVDHSFNYSGLGPGDLRSAVVVVHLEPAGLIPIQLRLSKRVTEEHPVADTESIKLVTFQSPVLSAFWGRPIMMRAAVVLPPSYQNSGKRRYPTVYKIHGFGGTHLRAWRDSPALLKKMVDGSLPEMINVYLDGSCPMGHHEFADSANNGPWGRALTREFIPYLESRFRMDAVPRGRLLTGHSSGGWSTMWLQVTYPEVFGGTWSTSPDPVDFRSFSGADLTRFPSENLYLADGGKPRNIFRYHGQDVFSWDRYARFERVVGEYGGQMESFEAVFSPRGEDGRPMQLFDRDTGAINPTVQKAWQSYNISQILVNNWQTLGPKLKGKLHLVVGTADNFHLEEAVYLLRNTLKTLGSDATFEFIEGRDHMDLYEGDLADRIAHEMYEVARPGRKAGR